MLSAKLLLLAVIFDSLDGYVARKFKDEYSDTTFGENIDSLSDVISFGVAPAVILYILTGVIWMLIPVILLVVCGVLRLTRYNTVAFNQNKPTTEFVGLPIPVSAMVLGSLVISSIIDPYILFIVMTIIALLMVTEVEYPKMSNKIVMGVIGIFTIICLLPDIVNITLFKVPSLLLLSLTMIYVIGIPILNGILVYKDMK
jgi:CDP-diacylglycerol--serine O-phosphatidyltransferase